MEYKIIGAFFLYVIQMQMIEYLLWVHRVKCDAYNINISTIGSILNNLQPLVLLSYLGSFLISKYMYGNTKAPVFIVYLNH